MKYLNVLDFTSKAVKIIRLSKEESQKVNLYSSIYDFLQFEKIDEKYNFDLGNSEVMITEEINMKFV